MPTAPETAMPSNALPPADPRTVSPRHSVPLPYGGPFPMSSPSPPTVPNGESATRIGSENARSRSNILNTRRQVSSTSRATTKRGNGFTQKEGKRLRYALTERADIGDGTEAADMVREFSSPTNEERYSTDEDVENNTAETGATVIPETTEGIDRPQRTRSSTPTPQAACVSWSFRSAKEDEEARQRQLDREEDRRRHEEQTQRHNN
eukprot:IDg5038t1